MMPAQLVDVAEAALGPPPSTREFLARLTEVGAPQATDDVTLFGETFAHAPRQPQGSEKK